MKRKPPDYVALFIVFFAIFLGGFFRFRPVLLTNFPLNDGGLFYQMTRDLLDNHFRLPNFTSYNGSVIPFGYPPLAFYLMAGIQYVFHVGIIDQLRFLPALFSTLSIPVFYFLSRSMTGSKEKSAFAVLAFAIMPGSFIWLIMGGGITRSVGFLLAMLAILCIFELFRKPNIGLLLLSILFGALTILSHIGTAWFVFVTSALIFFWYGLNKKGIIFASLTVVGILLLTSPWWVTIILSHGISVLINSASTGDFFSLSVAIFYFTRESFVTVLAVLSIFGMFAELIRRKYFLFTWLVLIMLLCARSGDSFASIPGSMFVGSGIIGVLIPGLLSYSGRLPDENQTLEQLMSNRIVKIILGFILVIAFWGPMSITYLPETTALSQDDRLAMQWVSDNTYSSDQFAVLTGMSDWYIDGVSEWFPALSNRISVATVQGSEWLPDSHYLEKYELLQRCANKDFDCVRSWADENDLAFSYIYLNKPKVKDDVISLPIAYSFVASDHVKLVYDNSRASIYRVVDGP